MTLDVSQLPIKEVFEALNSQDFNTVSITSIQELKEVLQDVILNFWRGIRYSGLSFRLIDNIFILFVLVRLILVSIRYNIITGFAITAISVAAAYVWYNALLGTILTYGQVLFNYSLTYRFAKDVEHMQIVARADMNSPDFQIRLTNPFGILAYAVRRASISGGYRIDPISIMVASFIDLDYHKDILRLPFGIGHLIPEDKLISTQDSVEAIYHLFATKFLPLLFRNALAIASFVKSTAAYSFVTRVNKRYCPYLVRWHWTMLVTFRFIEGFWVQTAMRISFYLYNEVYPITMENPRNQYLMYSRALIEWKKLEGELLHYMILSMIIVHVSFLLYAMFHALAGQYFFLPFATRITELHIGPRDPLTIYSAGNTAWQDPKERNRVGLFPKLWYGWFGRGTNKPNWLSFLIQRFLYKPIYKFIKSLFRFLRRK